MSKLNVHIENPIADGPTVTSLNRARRFVRRGRASWVGIGEHRIRFTDSGPVLVKPAAPSSPSYQRHGFRPSISVGAYAEDPLWMRTFAGYPLKDQRTFR